MTFQRAWSTCFVLSVLPFLVACSSEGGGDGSTPAVAQIAPSTYAAYSGTDPKPSPTPPPDLGPANSVLVDPTFARSAVPGHEESQRTRNPSCVDELPLAKVPGVVQPGG